MKYIVLVLSCLLLAGCGAEVENETYSENGVREYDITLQDGRTAHCIEWASSGSGRYADCEWSNEM